ncbi:hypothetical protein HWV62_22501 [Athelia sp. TMB]|nr:hypothetical protein HWV62_22501 [Athelia sp. TMB]
MNIDLCFHGAPMAPHHHHPHHTKPPTLQSADVEEGTEALTMQLYCIELEEQHRLLGVMEYHSKESGPVRVEKGKEFPFSITAGMEKGEKNQ